MVSKANEPVALCTVRVGGRNSTVWLCDPADGSPPLPLSVRRARLAEVIREAEASGADPESLAAERTILQALDAYIREHGDPFASNASPESA